MISLLPQQSASYYTLETGGNRAVALAAGVAALLLLLLVSIFSESPAEKHSLVNQNYDSPRSLHTSSQQGDNKLEYPPSPSHGYRGEHGQLSHHSLPSPVGPPPVAPPGNSSYPVSSPCCFSLPCSFLVHTVPLPCLRSRRPLSYPRSRRRLRSHAKSAARSPFFLPPFPPRTRPARLRARPGPRGRAGARGRPPLRPLPQRPGPWPLRSRRAEVGCRRI